MCVDLMYVHLMCVCTVDVCRLGGHTRCMYVCTLSVCVLLIVWSMYVCKLHVLIYTRCTSVDEGIDLLSY